MRQYLRSKIQNAWITEANLDYVGSITIDKDLLEKADLQEYEKVLVVSKTSGSRLETYVIEGEAGSGEICMNGPASHLITAGEEVIILAGIAGGGLDFAKKIKTVLQTITPAKIQGFVNQFFNGHRTLHIADLPPDAFARPEDLPWLIYTIAYGHHPEVNYGVDPLPGEPVSVGPVRVKPFQLVKK